MFDKNKRGKKYIPEGTKNGSPLAYQLPASLTIKNTKFLNKTLFTRTLTNFETFDNTPLSPKLPAIYIAYSSRNPFDM